MSKPATVVMMLRLLLLLMVHRHAGGGHATCCGGNATGCSTPPRSLRAGAPSWNLSAEGLKRARVGAGSKTHGCAATAGNIMKPVPMNKFDSIAQRWPILRGSALSEPP